MIVGLLDDELFDPRKDDPPDLLSDLLGLSGSRTSTMICDPHGVLVGEGDDTGEVVAELLVLLGFRKKYSFAALLKIKYSWVHSLDILLTLKKSR